MARTPHKPAPILPDPSTVAEGHAITLAAEQELRRLDENTLKLADQLGYEGSLAVDALEDEIRFYQRRTVEAILETGKRLLILKELTPHGEFEKRVELLGFSVRTARRFMQAANKTSKSAILADLSKQAKNGAAFLELVTHDDDDLKKLNDLDDIDRMGPSELRAALRDAREDATAKDKVLSDKNTKIDELAAELNKKKRKSPLQEANWPEQIDGLKDDLHTLGKVMDEVLSKHLTLVEATELVYQGMDEGDPAHDQYKSVVFRMSEQIERLCTLAAGLRHQFGVTLSGYIGLEKTYLLPYGDQE